MTSDDLIARQEKIGAVAFFGHCSRECAETMIDRTAEEDIPEPVMPGESAG